MQYLNAATPSALALGLTLILPTALAADDEHRSHGAHAHGQANLDLAVDGGLVLIGLESPAANIVGFEHVPANAKENAALDSALAGLRDGSGLFRLSADARCELTEATVGTPLTGAAGQEAGSEAHADIHGEYLFECAEPDRLVQLELGLFKAFPAIRSLQVRFAGPKGQGAKDLTAASPVLKLR